MKYLAPEEWVVSAHGRWNAVHIGAFEASYGRTPYFAYFLPRLREILLNPPELALDLNKMLMRWIIESSLLEDSLPSLCVQMEKEPALVANRRNYLLARSNDEQSLIEPLFKFGPEIVYLFADEMTLSLISEIISETRIYK